MGYFRSLGMKRRIVIGLCALFACLALVAGIFFPQVKPKKAFAEEEVESPYQTYTELDLSVKTGAKIYSGFTTRASFKSNLTVTGTYTETKGGVSEQKTATLAPSEYVLLIGGSNGEADAPITAAEGMEEVVVSVRSNDVESAGVSVAITTDEIPSYRAITAQLPPSITNDHTNETIKKLLTVTGEKEDGSSEQITDPALFAVSIPAWGNVNDGIEITVTYTNPNKTQVTATARSTIAVAELQDVIVSVNLPQENGIYKKTVNGKKYSVFVVGGDLPDAGTTNAEILSSLEIVAIYPNSRRALTFTNGVSTTGENCSVLNGSFSVGVQDIRVSVTGGNVSKEGSVSVVFQALAVQELEATYAGLASSVDKLYPYSNVNTALQFNVYAIYNSGYKNTSPLRNTDYKVSGALTPTSEQLEKAKRDGVDLTTWTYSKPVTLTHAENESATTEVTVTDIFYAEPTRFGDISGTLADQTIFQPFNYDGLYITMRYADGSRAENIPLTEIKDYCTVELLDDAGESVGNTITRYVTKVVVHVSFPKSNGTFLNYNDGDGEPYTRQTGLRIIKATHELLEVDTEHTFEEGLTTEFEIDSALMTVELLSPENGATLTQTGNNVTLAFENGNEDGFVVRVKLKEGDKGDYRWASSVGNPNRYDDYTLDYTIYVHKGYLQVGLQLNDTAVEGSLELTYGDAKNFVVTGTTSSGTVLTNTAGDFDAGVYYYGPTLSGHTTYATATTTEPKDVGTYYVYARTVVNDKYLESSIEWQDVITLRIKKKPILLTGTNLAGVVYDREEHSVSNFIASGAFAYDDGADDVLDYTYIDKDAAAPTGKYIHVCTTNTNGYQVNLKIKSSKANNYEWDSEMTVTGGAATFYCKITPAQVSISVTNDHLGFTYSDDNATVTAAHNEWLVVGKNVTINGFAVVGTVTYKNSAGEAKNIADSATWDAGDYTVEVAAALDTTEHDGVTDLATDVDLDSAKASASFHVARKTISLPKLDDSWTKDYQGAMGYAIAIDPASGNDASNYDKLTVTVEGKDAAGNADFNTGVTVAGDNRKVTVVHAGEYTVSVAIAEAYAKNYKWNTTAAGGTDEVIAPVTYTVSKIDYTFSDDYKENKYFDSTKTEQFVPTLTATGLTATDASETPFTTKIYTTKSASNEFSGEISSVTEVGTYYLVIESYNAKEESGFSYNNNYQTPATHWVEFAILSFGLQDVTATDQSFTYKGTGNESKFYFSSVVQNWSTQYCYDNGNKHMLVLWVVATGTTKNETGFRFTAGHDAAMTDVCTYEVYIFPNDNFTWNSNTGKTTGTIEGVTGEKIYVKHTVTIEPKSVSFKWTPNQTFTYNKNVQKPTIDSIEGVLEADKNSVGADVGAASNYDLTKAGYQVAKVTKLNGDRAFNYALPDVGWELEHPFTIEKAEVTNPGVTASDPSFTGETITFTFSNSSEEYDVAVSGKYAFGDFTVNHTETYTATKDGFTAIHAGTYTVKFTLKDSDNYKWKSEQGVSGTKSEVFTTDITIGRMGLTAPLFNKGQRAQEYKHEDGKDDPVLTPAFSQLSGNVLTLDNGTKVYVSVSYGSYAEDRKIIESDTASSKLPDQYFIRFTLSSDNVQNPYDYLWNLNGDEPTNTFIEQWNPSETCYEEGNVSVRLSYAITLTQLSADYTLENYVFGANGQGGSVNISKLTLVADATATGIITSVATVTPTFYDLTDEEVKGLQDKTLNLNGITLEGRTAYTDLSQGLPWEAGYYLVVVSIVFPETSVYQSFTPKTWFRVEQKTLAADDIVWSENAENGASATEQDGAYTVTVIYNGEVRTLKAELKATSMPRRAVQEGETDATALPTFTLNNPTAKNVGDTTWTIGACSDANFAVPEGALSATLTIGARTVSVAVNYGNVTSGTHVYGAGLTPGSGDAKWWSYAGDSASDSDKQFCETTDFVTFTVKKGEATYALNALINAGTGYTLLPELTAAGSNYTLEVVAVEGSFEIARRAITVTVNEALATSKYGETVDLYNAVTVACTNATGNWFPAGKTTTDVFTLSSDATAAATALEKLDANGYAITLVFVDTTNYTINGMDDGAQQTLDKNYKITPADITAQAGETPTVTGNTNYTYDAAAHKIFAQSGRELISVDAKTKCNQEIKWFYATATAAGLNAPADTVWTEFTNQTVTDAGPRYYFVKAEAVNHEPVFFQSVETNIAKKEATVKVEISIYYGEENPANFNGSNVLYLGTLGDLRATGSIYTVSEICPADAGKFFDKTDSYLTGSFGYSVTYTKGANGVGDYAITFDGSSLVSTNYTFKGIGNVVVGANETADGVLHVQKAPVSVTIHTLSRDYNTENANLADHTGATPAFTLTATEVTSYGTTHAVPVYHSKYEDIFTLATTAEKSSPIGDYPVYVKTANDNYAITFTADKEYTGTETPSHVNGTPMGTYTVTAAALDEVTVGGYHKAFDQDEHNAFVNGSGTEISADASNFATRNDGNITDISVSFYEHVFTGEGEYVPLTAEELAALADSDWQSAMPVYIDAGTYYVYYRIVAENYETVIKYVTVTVSQATNEITGTFNFANGTVSTTSTVSNDAWVYGIWSATVSNGYNKDGNQKIVQSIGTKFSRKPGGDKAVVTMELTRSGEGADGLTLVKAGVSLEKIEEMFADIHADTGFKAGTYHLTFTMGGNDNFTQAKADYYFKVAKRDLTVTPDVQNIVFGAEAPKYDWTMTVAGTTDNQLVCGKTGVRDTWGTAPVFGSDYVTGWESGTVGKYTISVQNEAAAKSGVMENYNITFATSNLAVAKRTVHYTIDSLTRAYGELESTAGTQYRIRYDYSEGNEYELFGDDMPFTLQHNAFLIKDNQPYFTNHARKYPIYATYNTDKDYAANYEIVIDTVYVYEAAYDEAIPDGAIGKDENRAGTFEITPAPIAVIQSEHLKEYLGNKQYGSADLENVYDGKQKGYVGETSEKDPSGNAITFIPQYFKGTAAPSIDDLKARLDDESRWTYDAPKNVGSYYYRFVSDNTDYSWNTASAGRLTISPKNLSFTATLTGGSLGTVTENGKTFYSVTYNGAKYELELTLNGLVSGESLTLNGSQSGADIGDDKFVNHDLLNLGEITQTSTNGIVTFGAQHVAKYTVTVAFADNGALGSISNYTFSGAEVFNWNGDNHTVSFEFRINRVGLTVSVDRTTVEYGTVIDNGVNAVPYPAGLAHTNGSVNRFGGFEVSYSGAGASYVATDETNGWFSKANISFTTAQYPSENSAESSYNQTMLAGTHFYVTAQGINAHNFDIDYNSYGVLEVIRRQVRVKVSGVESTTNTVATAVYNGGNRQTTLNELLAANRSKFLTVVDEDWTALGKDLSLLNVRLGVNSAINVDKYEMTPEQLTIDGRQSSFEVVEWQNYEGTKLSDADSTKRPQFEITPKALTVKAVVVAGGGVITYGNALSANGREEGTQILGIEFIGLASTDGNANGYTKGLTAGECITTAFTYNAYTQWKTHAGTQFTATPSGFVLHNYTITSASVTLTVGARKVTASTENKQYEEDGSDYHGGLYGAAREADVVFKDASGSVDFNTIPTGHAPSANFDRAYSTSAISNWQEAGKAPRTVGKYTVTVTFKGTNAGDYVFDTENQKTDAEKGESVTSTKLVLFFEVTAKPINLAWEKTSNLTLTGSVTEIDNAIADYVAAVMEVDYFHLEQSDGSGGTTATEQAWASTGIKLTTTVTAMGEYTIRIYLNADAEKNYTLNGSTFALLRFRVASTGVEFTQLKISDWAYRDTPSDITLELSNGSHVANLTFAPVTVPAGASYSKGTLYTEARFGELGLTVGTYGSAVPQFAGLYVVRAYYAGTADESSATGYVVFEVTKRRLAVPTVAPVLEAGEDKAYYTGSPRTATVTFGTFDKIDLSVFTMNYAGINSPVSEFSVEVQGLNAATYTVSFTLTDTDNYAWASATGETCTATWQIFQATSNPMRWKESETGDYSAVYGDESVCTITATFGGGDVQYYTITREIGSSKPEANDNRWRSASNLPRNVGSYWVKAEIAETPNYVGNSLVGSLEVTPATLTVIPNGTLEYGLTVNGRSFSFLYNGFKYPEDNASILNTSGAKFAVADADAQGKVNVGEHVLTLQRQGDGYGITCSTPNYTLEFEEGTLTVTKKTVYVMLNTYTAHYGLAYNPQAALSAATCPITGYQLAFNDTFDDLQITLRAMVNRDEEVTRTTGVGMYDLTGEVNSEGNNYNVIIISGHYVVAPLNVRVVFGDVVTSYGEGNKPESQLRSVSIEVNNDWELITSANIATWLGEVTYEAFVTELSEGLNVYYVGTTEAGEGYEGTAVPTQAGRYRATVQGTAGDGKYNLVSGTSDSSEYIVNKQELNVKSITFSTAYYTGYNIDPADYMEVAGVDRNTFTYNAEARINVGTYNVSFTLVDVNNFVWVDDSGKLEGSSQILRFTIAKAPNAFTGELTVEGWTYGDTANVPQGGSVTHGGSTLQYRYAASEDGTYTTTVPSNAGTYWVKAFVPETGNYASCESAPVSFVIEKRAVSVPTLAVSSENGNDTYTGGTLYAQVVGYNRRAMAIVSNSGGTVVPDGENISVTATNAGTYKILIALGDTDNYCWAEGTQLEGGNVVCEWTVNRKKLTVPTANPRAPQMVTGGTLTNIPIGFDPETMDIKNNTTSYGDTYTMIITLKDPDNYEWANLADDAKFAPVEIGWVVLGWEAVFVIIASVLGGFAGIALIGVGAQCLLHWRKKRLQEAAEAEAEREFHENIQAQVEANKQGGDNPDDGNGPDDPDGGSAEEEPAAESETDEPEQSETSEEGESEREDSKEETDREGGEEK